MTSENETPIFRPAGISYLRVPAQDPQATALFYEQVFGWRVDTNRSEPSFEDGTGHVIGHFVPDGAAAGEAGVPRSATRRGTSWVSGSAGRAIERPAVELISLGSPGSRV